MRAVEHVSFRDLLYEKAVRPAAFKRNVEALEAAELMATITNLGDSVIQLTRRGLISVEHGEELLEELVECFARPDTKARRVFEISKELREHQR